MHNKMVKKATKLLLAAALMGGLFTASTDTFGTNDMLNIADMSQEEVKADIQPAEQLTVSEPDMDATIIPDNAEVEEESDEVIIAVAYSDPDLDEKTEEEVVVEEVVATEEESVPTSPQVVEDVPVSTTTPVVAEEYYPATVQVEIPDGVAYCSFRLIDQNGAVLADYQMVPSCGNLFTSAISSTPSGTLAMDFYDAAGNYLASENQEVVF